MYVRSHFIIFPESGVFTQEENQLLIKAIQAETGIQEINELFYGLPWTKIAKHFSGTRSALQCRNRW